jgi:hypothetical protein
MSKLKDVMLSCLEGTNKELTEIIDRKTTAAENLVREKVVIPYCKKWGYSFASGMGGWCVIDKAGKPFYPGEDCRYATADPKDGRPWEQDGEHDWFLRATEEDKEFREILEWGFDCMNQGIGSYIRDYVNDGLQP